MTISGSAFLKYAGASIIALAVGFFAGREELKYEIRTTLQSAQDFQNNLSAAPSGNAPSAQIPAQASAPTPPPPPTISQPSPVGVTLIKKGFKASNPQAGDFEDDITFELGITDESDKDIRAFDGTLVFTDLLDNKIISVSLAINDPVKIGSPTTWKGGLKYNQFIDSHQRLRSEPQSNLKVNFVPKKVLFADGSTKEYE